MTYSLYPPRQPVQLVSQEADSGIPKTADDKECSGEQPMEVTTEDTNKKQASSAETDTKQLTDEANGKRETPEKDVKRETEGSKVESR